MDTSTPLWEPGLNPGPASSWDDLRSDLIRFIHSCVRGVGATSSALRAHFGAPEIGEAVSIKMMTWPACITLTGSPGVRRPACIRSLNAGLGVRLAQDRGLHCAPARYMLIVRVNWEA